MGIGSPFVLRPPGSMPQLVADRRFPIRSRIAIVAWCATVAGCAPPRVVYRPLGSAVASAPSTIVVNTIDGREFRVDGARVRHDTLYGKGDRAPSDSIDDVRIPVSDISSIFEASQPMSGEAIGAVGFVLGMVAGAGALLLLLLASFKN
jgi:hypothetical protein